MKTKAKLVLIPITLFLFLLISTSPSFAQGQSPITATVDRATLSTDETLTLNVTVNAEALTAPTPMLPNMAAFNILETSSSSQISIINGAMNAQVVYNYRLQPIQAGDLTIEPVRVTIDGQTYTTQPITIQVTQGTGVPATSPAPSTNPTAPTSTEFAGQQLFVEAEVDNPNPYLGEQIIYTFRFYEASGLFGQPNYQPPTFAGFWNENQVDQSQYRAQAAGQIYNVTELRTVLFPSKVGSITIDPAHLTIPGGFFRSGEELQTQPIMIDVKPLPPNAPDNFNGAVGQFSLSGTIDIASGEQGKVNEPVTWEVTLSGQSNLSTLPDPIWPDMPNWRNFDSQATIKTQLQDDRMIGSRVYERLLVPESEGEFTIPALSYTYFDPLTETYQSISTQPIAVSIVPNDNIEAQGPTLGPNAGKETVEQVATDIRHLKAVPSTLNSNGVPVTASPLYWLAWVVPLISLAGNLFWQRRQQFWQNNAGLVRSSQASKKAKRSLAQARKSEQDVYSAAGLILTAYLADKLDQPVAGLTYKAMTDLLMKRGLQADLIEWVNACLASAELGRYSPDANDPTHASSLLTEIGNLIDNLEKKI